MDEITLEEERTEQEVGVGPSFPGFPAWSGLEEGDGLTKFAVEEPPEKEKREEDVVSWKPVKSFSGRWWMTVKKRLTINSFENFPFNFGMQR